MKPCDHTVDVERECVSFAAAIKKRIEGLVTTPETLAGDRHRNNAIVSALTAIDDELAILTASRTKETR